MARFFVPAICYVCCAPTESFRRFEHSYALGTQRLTYSLDLGFCPACAARQRRSRWGLLVVYAALAFALVWAGERITARLGGGGDFVGWLFGALFIACTVPREMRALFKGLALAVLDVGRAGLPPFEWARNTVFSFYQGVPLFPNRQYQAEFSRLNPSGGRF